MKVNLKRIAGALLSASILVTGVHIVALQPIEAVAEEKTVAITESNGWHESVYAKWTAFENAESYNVYVRAVSGDYVKLDAELVREYPEYYRADAPGLAAGKYIMKIVPVVNGSEVTAGAAETGELSVDNFVREGFAFSEYSPYGYTTGAYNKDGTLRSDAEVVYLTDANKETVTINGDEKKGKGIYNIMAYRQKNKLTTPFVIRILGKVTMPVNVTNYMMRVQDTQNVTIEGIGEDAALHGWGLTMKRACNVEFRNFAVMWHCQGTDGDALSFDTDNKNIFIHNMDFYYGAPGQDADQKKGDGTIDMKAKTDYVTISYNHFYDTGKTTFVGGQWELNNLDDPAARVNVTYHHNWFDHADSRHPRCVVGTVHVYNNYYDGVAGYGPAAAVQSSVFVESNYFRNVPRPMMIASQGSDTYISDGNYGSSTTLSGQDGGMIKAYNNIMITPKRFADQNTTETPGQIDAYTVTDKNEKVPETVKAIKGGWSYNNFDTAETMYSYNADSPEIARDKTIADAGRLNGGDLNWKFDNSKDDLTGSINIELQNAIKNYESKLLKAGGISVVPDKNEETTETTTAAVEGKLSDDYVWDLSKISTVPVNGLFAGEDLEYKIGSESKYDDEEGYYYLIKEYASSNNTPKGEGGVPAVGNIPLTGCFIGFTPSEDGKFRVAVRTGASKITYFNEGTETIKTIDNADSLENRFDVVSIDVKAGKTYYVFSAGSKARYAYIGFTAGGGSVTETSTEVTTEETTENTTEPENMLWGDADNNKHIEINDVKLVLNYILEPENNLISNDILKYVDVNKDGKINSSDAAMILQNVLDSSYNIGNN